MTNLREPPPWTLVIEILELLNISSNFPCIFQKGDLRQENFSSCASLLEPYYMPCKARLYLDYTDEVRWITILRHILHIHGYVIESLETTRNKKKAIFYTIKRSEGLLQSAISIDFS